MGDNENVQKFEKWAPKFATKKERPGCSTAEKDARLSYSQDKFGRYYKYRKDEMSRHLHLIRNKAIERRIQNQKDAGVRPPYCNKIGNGRLTRRVGFSVFAKQSEMVFNPNCLPPALRQVVREDIKALMARDPDDNADEWTKAPVLEAGKSSHAKCGLGEDRVQDDGNMEPFQERRAGGAAEDAMGQGNSADIGDSKVRASFFTPGIYTPDEKLSDKSQKQEMEKKTLFFPPDPPFHEIADRILSSLPFLTLRNGDATTYSRAACGIVANALKTHGIQASHDGTAVIARPGDSLAEEQSSREDILTSFYNKTAPFNPVSPDFSFSSGNVAAGDRFSSSPSKLVKEACAGCSACGSPKSPRQSSDAKVDTMSDFMDMFIRPGDISLNKGFQVEDFMGLLSSQEKILGNDTFQFNPGSDFAEKTDDEFGSENPSSSVQSSNPKTPQDFFNSQLFQGNGSLCNRYRTDCDGQGSGLYNRLRYGQSHDSSASSQVSSGIEAYQQDLSQWMQQNISTADATHGFPSLFRESAYTDHENMFRI